MDAKTDHKLLDDVSSVRRRLLRTAASVAPLIATLPSGAALAQGSALNCADKHQLAAASGLDRPDAIAASWDSYVRVHGTRTRYRFPFDNINDEEKAAERDVYEFAVPGTHPPETVIVDAEGNWIDLGESKAERLGAPEDQFFLVLYKAGFDGRVSELCDLENRVHTWPPGAPRATSPTFCIAPLATISDENIPLPPSCAASLADQQQA